MTTARVVAASLPTTSLRVFAEKWAPTSADWAVAVINEVIELLRSDYDTLVPVLEAIGEAMPSLGGVPAAVGGF